MKKPKWNQSYGYWYFGADTSRYICIERLIDKWYKATCYVKTGEDEMLYGLTTITYSKRLGTAKFLSEDYYFRRHSDR